MGVQVTRTLICDACRKEIAPMDQVFIDARVYGATLHKGCFADMDGAQTLRVLGLDDVLLANVAVVLEQDHDPNAAKAWAQEWR